MRGFIIHNTVSGLPLHLLCPSSRAQSLIEELIGKEDLASYFITQRSPTLDISFLSFKLFLGKIQFCLFWIYMLCVRLWHRSYVVLVHTNIMRCNIFKLYTFNIHKPINNF